MNKFREFLLLIVMLFCVAASAGERKQVIIINGYFFNELPAALKKSITPQDLKVFVIKTPEKISEGEELMRRYNEQKDASGGFSFTMTSDKPLIKVGDKFPDFSAVDIKGKTWTNADVKGKVMVLNLWFTGCGPCRKEMPELSTWKDEMPDVMFFSSTYESPEVARQVLDNVRFNWIPLVNDTQFKAFIGNNGYPLTIVVDKSGKIAAFEYGTSPEQRESLKNQISELR